MKIGTRVTLLTTLLVVLTLSLYGLVNIRARRQEVSSDVERQTQLLGSSLQVALEAAMQEGLYEDVRRLIERMQRTEQPILVVYLDLLNPSDSAAFGSSGGAAAAPGQRPDLGGADDEAPYQPPPQDQTREARLRRVQITGQPYGEHVDSVQRSGASAIDREARSAAVNDSPRPVYAYMVPLRGKDHRLVAVVDLIHDETEAQQSLRASTGDVIITVTLLSLALTVLLGLSVQTAFAGPLRRLVGGIDEVTSGDYTGAILRERNDEVGLLADRFNAMTGSLRQARAEILAGVAAKLQLESRLRDSDKLATIGQLAAGLAHEVGTPLNVIGGRARAMARRAEDPQEVRKNAEIIATQVERITRIIQQLLDYARRKAPLRGPVDLHRVAQETLDFLEHQLKSSGVHAALGPFEVAGPGGPKGRLAPEITGEVPVPPPAVPLVLGDPDQLQQVCLNLCMNAIQAMPDGGELELSLLGLLRRKPGLDRTPPGPYIMLAVADTGVGIPETDMERIFEPFYSTKHQPGPASLGTPAADSGRSDQAIRATDREARSAAVMDPRTGQRSDQAQRVGRAGGSGLGLAVSSGIVKDHDGWIEIERRAGGGTIFRLFFPALDPDEEDPKEHGAAPPQPEQSHAPGDPADHGGD